MRWLISIAGTSLVLSVAEGCGVEPFMYEDTAGHVCSPICQDGINSCLSNLTCNEPPAIDCADVRTPPEPCWTVSKDPTADRLELCQGCCGDNSEFVLLDTCNPLICDESDQPPAEPIYCEGGYLRLD